jgi:hypothetical protein
LDIISSVPYGFIIGVVVGGIVLLDYFFGVVVLFFGIAFVFLFYT